MGGNALRGKRIAILEARLGAQLAGLVASRGGVPLHAPALAELPDLDPQKIKSLVTSLDSEPARLAIFQTGVGTQALFKATDSLGMTPQFLKILDNTLVAARGPKPAGALRLRGVRVDRSAPDPYTTHEVLAVIGDVPLQGERVIVQRYGRENVELDRALEARGARVAEIPTYRWSLPQDTAPLADMIARLERREVDAAVFTNAEQVRNLFSVARTLHKDGALTEALNRTLVASIGPVASAALREAKVSIGVEASPPKLGALLTALESALP
jgi:uroporphyrinogen-III synthase